MDLNKISTITTISTFMTAPPNPPSPPSSNLSNPPISPKIPARFTILELRDKYRRNSRYIRYGSKDHWIRNYSLAPYNTLTGTTPGRQVMVVAINDNDYNDYNDSDDFELSSSYDGTRNELETKVDRMMADRPEIDWRRHVSSGTWK
jgi:hypothetical protein